MLHPAVKDFVRIIGGIDRSKHRSEVFRDFCEMAYCAHAKRMATSAERAEALERQYGEVESRYSNKADADCMARLLAIATMTLGAGGVDFLGLVAAEIGVLDGRLGQFFTPYEVSRLMAEMTFEGVREQIERDGFFTFSEPAAGAGGLIIATADVMQNEGYDPGLQMWFEAVELNRSTFHMLYLQMTLRGLSGRVFHGNSLSLETYSMSVTPKAIEFVGRHGDPFSREGAPDFSKAAE